MELTIDCKTRPEGSKPNGLRRSGQLPAVLYGHKGTESISLMIDAKAAENLIRDASVNNTLVQVNIPEMSWSGKALLREVQTHPWKHTPYHISFFAVADHGDLEVAIPITFVGTAKGVKVSGGSLEPVLASLRVKCNPSHIPESIEVDVSELDAGENLVVSQISLPEGVVAVDDADRVVASVIKGAS